MAGSLLVTPDSLKNRRQSLRHQRRLKAWQGIWRFFVLSSTAGGLVWTFFLPAWLVRDSSQVAIADNHFLSAHQIRHLLSISYPQSLWRLPIHRLSERLKEAPPLADAHITRQLLPPQITVTVRERQPVAIASASQGPGFLDAQGVWIPKTFYSENAQDLPPLALVVLGFAPQHRSDWSQMYPLIVRSPVKILAVDWRNPSNLILKTDLGMVHCGSYSERFSQQLQVLSKMAKLPARLPRDRVILIDLSDPLSPTLQLKPQPSPKKPLPMS